MTLRCISLTLLAIGLALAVPTRSAPAHSDGPHRRRLLSWSTTFCYLDEPHTTIPDPNCAGGVPMNAQPCSAITTERNTPCELAEGVGARGTDANRWGTDYTFKYCPERIVFVRGDGTQQTFCDDLRPVPEPNDWSTRRRPADSPDTAYTSGWFRETRCRLDWRFAWVDGRCIDSTRYLGEKCADGLECDNSGVNEYDGLHLSCASPSATNLAITEPTCVPSAFLLDVERDQCQCGWFDWWIGFACGASDGQCNGHACVLSTGDGNKYCDWQTNNNW